MTERRTIEVGALARVEGEGALHLTIEGDQVRDLRLEIYEPPRYFESFLRGREATELPDLVARVCGICPVAYQMSTVHALERIFEVTIDPTTRALRRLYYAGEWLESHLLHMMFLAAPDYLGLDDAFAIAGLHRAEVERALRLRKLGNRILELLGARSVNPVGVVIGGFARMPRPGELADLADALRQARGDAEALLVWFRELAVPRRPQEVELVSVRHPDEYPMNEGRILSSGGLDVAPSEFDEVFEEFQVEHSTALHSHIRGRGAYLVGPLARVVLNRDHLLPAASAAFDSLSDRFERPDPAASVFARGVEVLQAIDEALVAIEAVDPSSAGAPDWRPRAGRAAWATEAPRGTLWIEVATRDTGHVEEIRIVPPTSQNQARIEDDLAGLVPGLLGRSDDEVRQACEAAIRDYDPCISCATHFLTLHIERKEPGCASGS
ncbi:MAG: Ni/Fe hydrogenase subunit alpha [Myxococcota bacterium]